MKLYGYTAEFITFTNLLYQTKVTKHKTVTRVKVFFGQRSLILKTKTDTVTDSV